MTGEPKHSVYVSQRALLYASSFVYFASISAQVQFGPWKVRLAQR